MKLLHLCYRALLGGVLSGVLLVDGNDARADVLPWLANAVSDPFAADKKANGLINPGLKPDNCQIILDMKRKLNFNDVVIAVLCGNPNSKSAYLSLLAQADSYVTNYSAYLPNATATASRTRSTTFSPYPTGRFTDTAPSYGVTAGMTLYDFGQREFKLEGAEQALVAAGYSYDSTLQNMIATALNGYFQLLTAQNGVVVAKESEQLAKESYDAAALRHKIGIAPLADVLSAKGAYSQAELAIEQAENQLAQNQAALAILMGLPVDVPIQVNEVDNAVLEKDPFKGQVRALMERAKQKRDDLLASRATLEGAKKNLEALKRSDLATVTGTVNLGSSNLSPGVFNNPQTTRSQAVGISVSIPIFTGFTSTYNEKAAQEQLEAQEEGLAETELAVDQNVFNSWQNYQTAKLSWATSQDSLATATQLKNVALGRYKEGLGTILDVLNAESQYNTALQSQLQSRYNLLSARVNLVLAVGVLDLDTMQPQKAVDSSSVTTDSPKQE